MSCRLSSLILILFILWDGVNAQNSSKKEKYKIMIPYMKQVSSVGIFISEPELTKLIFEDMTSLNIFEVNIVPRDSSGEKNEESDVVISGSYKVEENLISLDYVVNIRSTGMKLLHRIDNTELQEIKKVLMTDISSIVTDFRIESDPIGAKVLLDGKEIGETPIEVEKELIGTHTFELKKNGFYGLIQDVEVTDSKIIKFSLRPEIVESFMVDEPPQPRNGMTEIQRIVKYPRIAKKLRIEGDVIVKVTINVDGTISETEVLKSIGEYGTTEAAINAIKEVKWKPGIKNKKPVKSSTTVVIRFKLSK